MRSPPPPANIPFPFCQCDKSTGNVPFTFDRTVTVKPGSALTGTASRLNKLYCFALRKTSCDPASPCCRQGLSKIEWWSQQACRSSVRNVFLDGARIDRQWGVNGTFKTPKLSVTLANTPDAGREICVELDRTAACPNLSSFCTRSNRGTCFYSIFSKDENCCPTDSLDVPANRRRLY